MLRVSKYKGVTLVELMISLTLGIVVLGGGIQIFISGQQAYNEAQRFMRLQGDLSLTNDLISSDIRSSSAVAISGNQLTITTLPHPVIYKRTTNGLEREVQGVSDVIVGQVTDLSFACVPTPADCSDPVGVRVFLTLEGGVPVSFMIGMRNVILSKKFNS